MVIKEKDFLSKFRLDSPPYNPTKTRTDLRVRSLRGKYCHVPFPITVIPPHSTIVLHSSPTPIRHHIPTPSRRNIIYEQVPFRSDIVPVQRFRRQTTAFPLPSLQALLSLHSNLMFQTSSLHSTICLIYVTILMNP